MGKPEKPGVKNKGLEEVPWDLVDRCFLPVVFSHALAVIFATIFNTLRISQISSFTLFILFALASLAATIFYHNLKVTAQGKAVVVTCCDFKLGYLLAKQLDDLGFTVFAGFTSVSCEEAVRLKEVSSARLLVFELNVRSETQIRAAVKFVKANLPPDSQGVWAVVNNACIASFGEVEWVPVGAFREASEANVYSVIRTTQAFLPLVRKTKGRVITVMSLIGRVPASVRAPYCAARASIEALTDCLRLEMRRCGVDVVVVEPGSYATGALWFADKQLLMEARVLWRHMSEELKEECGKDYFEYKIRQLGELYQSPEVELGPGLRALTDSICRTFPLARYTPVTSAEKVQSLVSDHLPRSVYDIIYS